MRHYSFSALLAALLCSLFSPTIIWAEVNTVTLNSIAPDSTLQSKAVQLSPTSLAAMMKPMRYKKELLFGEIFSSEESKIDSIFSSGKTIEVFSSSEIQALSAEISAMANTVKPRQAIAFKSEMGRVKGYVLFSGAHSIWYLASIEGRPAHQTKKLEDESYMLDDPEADSKWRNKVEKSYWHLKPQQNQSLYQDRPDWLRVPVKHVAATQLVKRAIPAHAPPPAAVHKTASVKAQSTVDTSRRARIDRLQNLLSRGLITSSEYDGKIVDIIVEHQQSHPAIGDQLEFLKQLREKNQISQVIYQSHRQELLQKL